MRPNTPAHDDIYAYQSHTSATRPPSLPRVAAVAPIVHNYYVQDDRTLVPTPLFLTPNISMDSLALSQPNPPTPAHRRGAGEQGYQQQQQQQQQRRKRDRVAYSNSNGGVLVDPYAASHQGSVRPITAGEERAHLNASIESHRGSKLPRKEPLHDLQYTSNDNNNNNSSVYNANDMHANAAELKRLRSQYDALHTLVTETRAELRRSREETERARSAADGAVDELRAAVARLTAHVELHAGRHAALADALSAVPALLNVCRADIATLQGEAKQTAAALAVLQSTVADLKAQKTVPTVTTTPAPVLSISAPVGSTVGAAATAGAGVGGGFGFNTGAKPAESAATTTPSFPAVENRSPPVPTGTGGAIGGFSFGVASTAPVAQTPQPPVVPEVKSENTANTNPFSASQQRVSEGTAINSSATTLTFPMNTSTGGLNPFAASQTNGGSSSSATPFGLPANTNPPATTGQLQSAKPLESIPLFDSASTEEVSLGSRPKKTSRRY